MSEYTPGEITQILAIPPSTLRRYVAMFGEHFSAGAQRKRGRIFDDRDVSIITRIRDLAGQGIPLEKIGPQLTETIDELPPAPGELPPATALAVVQRIGEHVAGLDQRQQEQGTQIEQQRHEIDELRRRLDQLTNELEDERRQPWYKRLFKRKE